MNEKPKVEMLASDECLAGIGESMAGRGKPDFTVTAVEVVGLKGGLVLRWETKSAGFGELTISARHGELFMDTETMGPAFVKSVLGKVVDDWFAAQQTGPGGGK
jgi:hypothetical protein